MAGLVYPACFLTLAALTGLAAASGRRWALRLPLIAATPLLALAVWWQLSQRDGWPTGSHPADGSVFVAGVVQQPKPGNPGAVYLWAQPPKSDTPRSYRLPYSSDLERQVARAASASKRGTRVGLRASGQSTSTRETRGTRAGSRGTRGETRTRRGAQTTTSTAQFSSSASSSALIFYRLPSPQAVAKGAP